MVVILTSGHNPGYQVSGSVIDKYGERIADARVSVDRGYGPSYARERSSTRTDPSGQFELSGLGCIPRTCTILAADGAQSAKMTIGEGCTETVFLCDRMKYCNLAEVTLIPRAPEVEADNGVTTVVVNRP